VRKKVNLKAIAGYRGVLHTGQLRDVRSERIEFKTVKTIGGGRACRNNGSTIRSNPANDIKNFYSTRNRLERPQLEKKKDSNRLARRNNLRARNDH